MRKSEQLAAAGDSDDGSDGSLPDLDILDVDPDDCRTVAPVPAVRAEAAMPDRQQDEAPAHPQGGKGGSRAWRGKGPGPGGGGSRGGRIWRPNAEVAERHVGTWRYLGCSDGEFCIRQTEKQALRIIEQVSPGVKASGLLEPRDKHWLHADMVSKDGSLFGTIRVRYSKASGTLISNFRGTGWPDWSTDTVAHKALDPAVGPPAGELATLVSEAKQACERASVHFKRGELQRAARCHKRALDSLQAHHTRWQGDGRAKMIAMGHGSIVKQLQGLQIHTLTSLALCHLQGEPPEFPAEPDKALEYCESAFAIDSCAVQPEVSFAVLASLKGRALAELGRPHEAMEALARAAELEPCSSGMCKEDVAGEERVLAQVHKLREVGNACVKRGDTEAAAQYYEEALTRLWGKPGLSDEEAAERIAAREEQGSGFRALLRITETAILTNLSLCYLQGQPPSLPPRPDRAVGLCELALAFDSENTKARFRKARGLRELGHHEEAELEFARVAKLRPRDIAIRLELARARTAAGEKRRQAREWEREAYRDLFDRMPPGFATPPPARPSEGWPADALPAPLLTLEREGLEGFAEQLAGTLEQDGEAAYTMELLQTIRYVVELQHGAGAGKQLARIVPLVQMMTSGSGARQSHEIGKGQRCIASYLQGLLPEQPLHEAASHPWTAGLAGHAGGLLAELKEEGGAELWEIPWAAEGGAPTWRAITLVRQGVWMAGDRFRKTRSALSTIQDLRPYEISFVWIPPHTMMKHKANANFVLTAHLVLELTSGVGNLCAGEWMHEWRSGDVVVFDPTYIHYAANNSGADCYLLACHFYHPLVNEMERYSLLFLAALMDCLQSRYADLFSAASLAPAAGVDLLRMLKYAA